MPFTMPYSKLYILTELSDNGVKFISVDRQKLDLLKYIYRYGTVNSIFVIPCDMCQAIRTCTLETIWCI